MTTTTPAHLAWLSGEVASWREAGLVDDDQAASILAGYQASRRFTLVRLLLGVGASFVGVGMLWLVLANLDAMTPTVRLVLVTLLWAATLVSGEVLASRRVSPPVVGAVRLLAAALVGAVVFQGAQAFAVAAYEPVLLACWSLGALAHGYAVRAVAPLVVGVLAAAGYVVWSAAETSDSSLGLVLGMGGLGAAMLALAALHEPRRPRFGAVWRDGGAALLLLALLVASIPANGFGEDHVSLGQGVGLVTAAVLAAAAVATADHRSRTEVLAALAAVGAAVGLVCWHTGEASLPHAVAAVGASALAAVAVAASGTARDDRVLVAIATTALVVAATLQAFAVLAPILDGAWLFLVLGVVLVGTGLLFDGTRRTIRSRTAPRRSAAG